MVYIYKIYNKDTFYVRNGFFWLVPKRSSVWPKYNVVMVEWLTYWTLFINLKRLGVNEVNILPLLIWMEGNIKIIILNPLLWKVDWSRSVHMAFKSHLQIDRVRGVLFLSN